MSASVESSTRDNSPASGNACTAGRMRTLWLRMGEIYGYRWTSAYGEDAEKGAGETWSKGLSGISPRGIADGLSAALVSSDPWPPTLPQFRAMCLGIPSFASVVRVIRGAAEKTAFSRLVWQHLDEYRHRTVDADKAERLLRDAYDLARDHVMAGGALPDAPVAQIDAPKPAEAKPADPEVAKRYIAEMAAKLRIEPATPHTEVEHERAS